MSYIQEKGGLKRVPNVTTVSKGSHTPPLASFLNEKLVASGESWSTDENHDASFTTPNCRLPAILRAFE